MGMTRTEIAALAITALPLSRRTHIDIMAIMNGLNLDTDEAVALRSEVGRRWSVEIHANGYLTDLAEVLRLAKDVTNSYARNPLLRSAA